MIDAEIATASEWFSRGRGRSFPGSGLGLAIVEAASKRSGGNFYIAIGPESGLTVTLTFPRHHDARGGTD